MYVSSLAPRQSPDCGGKKVQLSLYGKNKDHNSSEQLLFCLFPGLSCCVSFCLIFYWPPWIPQSWMSLSLAFFKLHLGGGHVKSEVWANPHTAQSSAARGERNGPNTSVKHTSFTCRNTKVSVTQQAERLWTLQHWVSHPLWTRVSTMCATFLSFTLLTGSAVWADCKSYLTDSFVFYPSNKGPYFPEIGHSPKKVYAPGGEGVMVTSNDLSEISMTTSNGVTGRSHEQRWRQVKYIIMEWIMTRWSLADLNYGQSDQFLTSPLKASGKSLRLGKFTKCVTGDRINLSVRGMLNLYNALIHVMICSTCTLCNKFVCIVILKLNLWVNVWHWAVTLYLDQSFCFFQTFTVNN